MSGEGGKGRKKGKMKREHCESARGCCIVLPVASRDDYDAASVVFTVTQHPEKPRP